MVVLTSLVLQGSTIAWAARRLRVNLPDEDDTPAQRLVFGDFALDGATAVADVCAFYGLPEPPHADWPLQRFVHHPDGRVELRGSGLCLTAGAESDRTFEPTHRWRTLAVQRCNHADPKLSRWEFVVPKASMR